MDSFIGDHNGIIRFIIINWCYRVLLCPGSILHGRPDGWYGLRLGSMVHVNFSSHYVTFQIEFCSLGHWSTELWILELNDVTNMHSSFSCSFILVARWYKKRKREDVLLNEHIFAEEYYSVNI